jgi:hypothetical protein
MTLINFTKSVLGGGLASLLKPVERSLASSRYRNDGEEPPPMMDAHEAAAGAGPALARSDLLAARVDVPANVVHRPFPTETVVLNLETGRYHGLNPVAGRMLEELGRQETVGAAARVISDEYGQPLEEVERDLCVLCEDLVRRGLISLDVGAGR